MKTRIDVGSHALEIERSGDGTATFVCLHGLADTLEVWRRIVPALGRRGRVVLVNQRGHGGSEAPSGAYRREDLAADVRSVLDALAIPRVVLIGHSMGGIVALTAALLFPERVSGLVLLGTTGQCNRRAADWYETIAVAGEREGLAGLRAAIFGPGARREIAGDASGIARVTRCLRSLFDDPLTPKLPGVLRPSLVLVGSRDPMGAGASSILFRALPRATLEIVPERGHWLHLEDPDAVVRAVGRFLRVEAAALGFGADPPV